MGKCTAFVFDMDGVLTDGSLIITDNNTWLRTMFVRDGYALQLAAKKGYPIIIISGSEAPPVKDRLNRLGIQEVFFKVKDKAKFLRGYAEVNRIDLKEVLVMGDDTPDIEMMKICGFMAAPADAAEEVMHMVHYVSPYNGGRGCVRDVIEKVMKLQGKWNEDIEVTST
ncbi:MAG: HAD-IIIA family hydrolase [Chitinophagaceae bacterium]|nr:HAD-IIIA family hydrolase [Chitinophagaceae bacterium]